MTKMIDRYNIYGMTQEIKQDHGKWVKYADYTKYKRRIIFKIRKKIKVYEAMDDPKSNVVINHFKDLLKVVEGL